MQIQKILDPTKKRDMNEQLILFLGGMLFGAVVSLLMVGLCLYLVAAHIQKDSDRRHNNF